MDGETSALFVELLAVTALAGFFAGFLLGGLVLPPVESEGIEVVRDDRGRIVSLREAG